MKVASQKNAAKTMSAILFRWRNTDLAANVRYWRDQALGAMRLREGIDVVRRVFGRWSNQALFSALYAWHTNFMEFVNECGGMEAMIHKRDAEQAKEELAATKTALENMEFDLQNARKANEKATKARGSSRASP